MRRNPAWKTAEERAEEREKARGRGPKNQTSSQILAGLIRTAPYRDIDLDRLREALRVVEGYMLKYGKSVILDAFPSDRGWKFHISTERGGFEVSCVDERDRWRVEYSSAISI